MCDNCNSQTPDCATLDIREIAQAALKILERAERILDMKLTPLKLVNALIGKGESKLRLPDWKPSHLDKDKAEFVVLHLLLDGYLKEDFAFTPYSTISYLISNQRPLPGSLEIQVPWSKSYVIPKTKPVKKVAQKRKKIQDFDDSDFECIDLE